MRNCLILGSGRSGTSLMCGLLSQAGYFMGENLYSADVGNLKGYYEDLETNRINEELLDPLVLKRPSGLLGRMLFRKRLVYWQRWLARIPTGTQISCPDSLTKSIRSVLQHEPYCLKDPRFCYTLPIWRRFTNNVVFLCVFRHPGITATSLVKEAKRDSDIRHITLTFGFRQALRLWELMYRHVLEIHHPLGGQWLFIHYNQMVENSTSIYQALEKILHVSVDYNFADVRLNRSISKNPVPHRTLLVYQQLCQFAGYVDQSLEEKDSSGIHGEAYEC